MTPPDVPARPVAALRALNAEMDATLRKADYLGVVDGQIAQLTAMARLSNVTIQVVSAIAQ